MGHTAYANMRSPTGPVYARAPAPAREDEGDGAPLELAPTASGGSGDSARKRQSREEEVKAQEEACREKQEREDDKSGGSSMEGGN